ncbi:Ras family protein [Tritrichomonas foetus]|uniref:Ras family protein n=1 Tax=Tritrichomonas foetus TaxID=1144522 RepID=A0A1J4KTJ0_9EUKA|nr:Ras family protein [Tritrichomonas foetus]|eukprot:OHT12805.1 Ras family protein [Tritrichomonas foetus]
MDNSVLYKVVFIGDTAVGKTSIISQFVYNTSNPDHQPTIGIDFFAKNVEVGDQTVRMQIWDTAGQERFHSIIPSYIRSSSVAVIVYDITSSNSFTNLAKWHKIVTSITDPAIVIVGNKVDLETDRATPSEKAESYANSICAKYIETSARTPINISELFTMIAKIPINKNDAPPKNEDKGLKIEKLEISGEKSVPANNQTGCGC